MYPTDMSNPDLASAKFVFGPNDRVPKTWTATKVKFLAKALAKDNAPLRPDNARALAKRGQLPLKWIRLLRKLGPVLRAHGKSVFKKFVRHSPRVKSAVYDMLGSSYNGPADKGEEEEKKEEDEDKKKEGEEDEKDELEEEVGEEADADDDENSRLLGRAPVLILPDFAFNLVERLRVRAYPKETAWDRIVAASEQIVAGCRALQYELDSYGLFTERMLVNRYPE
ncbi:hypothetical protein IW262DRAFT_1298555 [Armillaria fumosa]|nr:hypothetical protein IW262DRAFT_1298555 [Armillaria fumosa]